MKEWDTASGWSFHDHNAGAPAAVARVEFEAAGASWVVEAWKNAEKTLSWSVTPGAARSAA